MRASERGRGVCVWALAISLFALGLLTALAVKAAAAVDPPPAQNTAPLSAADRKKLLAERDRLSAESQQLQSQGKLAEAIASAEKMLAIERKVLGDFNEGVVSSLERLAQLHEARKEFAAARQARQSVLATCTKLYGEKDWRATDARLAIDKIIRLSQLDREQRRELSAADWAISQAAVFDGKGDARQAVLYAARAFQIRRRILVRQGYLEQQAGDYAKAEPLHRQALAIKKKLLGEAHPSYAISLNHLAMMYQLQGDYTRAEPLYRQALEINKKALGETHPSYAASVHNVAWLYLFQGDYAKAEPLFRQALEIVKKAQGDTHPDYATTLDNLGQLHKAQGDYAQAESLFRRALEIRKKVLGATHPAFAESLNDLAALYRSQGDYAQAEPLYRQALEIFRNVLGEAHPNYARILNNLSALYRTQGNYAKAELLLRQALAIVKKALGETHPDYATNLNSLAWLYRSQADYAKAEPLCRQALEIYEKHLASTLRSQSERQQLAMAKLLRSNLDDYLSLTETTGARERAAEAYRHVLGWKGAVFMRQFSSRGLRSRPDFKPLFDDLLSVSARLSTLALKGPRPKEREVWQRQITELTNQKEALEAKLSSTSAEFREQQGLLEPKPQELQRALPQNVALVDFLEYTHSSPPAGKKGPLVRERHLAAFVVRHDQPIVRVELGPVEPLADATENWRRAILLDAGGAEDITNAATGTTKKLPQQILREAIWDPFPKYLNSAQIVLISPDGVLNQVPLAALPGQKPGSYLVEETKLAFMPVPRLLTLLLKEPLLTGPGNNPNSANASIGNGSNKSLLIVGDVTYGGSPGKAERIQIAGRSAVRGDQARALHFPELEYSRSEMATIRDSFEKNFPDGKVRSLRGDGATESAFRQEAPHYRFLHLATHGFFAPPEITSALAASKEDIERGFGEFGRQGISGYHPGLLSGVALSGANTPVGVDEDDGILTAVEVAGLDLERADLVVLSACETGLGSVAGGEGVLGLQRAFQMSGAKTTVTTLWKIPDRATDQLMKRFYENLWDKKLSKVDALRDAQLWMLKEGRQRGLDLEDPSTKKPTPGRLPPKYWAAFVLSGDWR